ncbi:MAG TPA: hypothetical protein PLL20_03625 [Phycisphaerae bacterium]|nr:hypothetical protein [Phycisphaerae bacterium]HRR87100.1 hypothetical protein [Phycisphaerae bacterium]
MTPVAHTRFARRFVPAEAGMGTGPSIEPLFDALDARPIETVGQFEQWILDGSELASCLSEEHDKRLVAMTCQTDDQSPSKSPTAAFGRNLRAVRPTPTC